MHIVFYLQLIVQLVLCADNGDFATTTAAVGENVTLSCQRHASGNVAALLWIRVAGNMPEILGKTFNFNHDDATSSGHITTKQEPGRFILHITEATLSDTAFYYCLKSQRHNVAFLTGTFLRIKGPEPDFTAVVQNSLAEAVNEGDSVSLQCSVLSESENHMCSEERRMFWFRVASDESDPSFIYAAGKCEKNPESPQSCVYNFFRENVSLSDSGTYYCALAACGKVVFGNGTKLEIEDFSTNNSETNKTFLLLLCVTWVMVLIAAALCLIRKTSCETCKASVCLETSAEPDPVEQQNQQRREDSVVYSAAVFKQRKSDRAGRRNQGVKTETIYTDVRTSLKE